ncbi:hypothetical protein NDU88_002848 [Pleurodeles waltl]|uniref:Uncharacterized protein n=1 Tax=Pleurodeles waltl TaxID=8319 RepID=A0AAV7NN38_PLEWA|nr:hypothetical protein NDU88_002848 [Pleurodeles waltl]
MHHDIQGLLNDFKDLASRITEAESSISALEDANAPAKKQTGVATQKPNLLVRELSELEDRNCRGNLQIFGLPENVEHDGICCAEFLES